MKRTLLLILSVATLLASFGVASVANAADDDSKARGEGVLDAHGDGIALLGGKGTITLSGNGILWVKDVSGDAIIEVTGYGEKREYEDGWVMYAGFNGTAYVEGSRVKVGVAGVDVTIHAEGRGRARLWGHGTCTVNGETREWGQGLPEIVEIAPAA